MTHEMTGADLQSAPVKLWDLPVRLVHWSFVALIPALWISAEKGKLDLHVTLGLVMLGLVAFRLLWGLVGSSTARFSGFLRGPAAIRAHLAGTGSPVAGHNPLGALSVIALLGLLAAQVTLGLFSQDTDAVSSGPLNFLVSWDTGKAASQAHEIGFALIQALIVLHVAAIVWYRLKKRDNLVTPMITGRKRLAAGVAAPRIAPWWLALLCAAVAAALAVWVAWGLPPWGMQFPWDRPPASAQMDAADYM